MDEFVYGFICILTWLLGIIEGYVAEKAALEEALNLKEESERRLVVELENMRERFQELTQEQAILGEERVWHTYCKTKLSSVRAHCNVLLSWISLAG